MRGAAGSALALVLAVAVACAVALPLDVGTMDGLSETIALAVPLGAAWLVAAHLVARRRSTGPLRTQLVVLVVATLLVSLLAVTVLAQRMFVSSHDAAILVTLMAFSAIVGARTASLLAARTADDVERVRRSLDAVAEGDLEARAEVRGPAEVQALARSANAMAASLARAQSERDAADRARRGLVAAVSHDLRTPLTSLRLLVEAIRDGVVDDPAEMAAGLDRASLHVDQLTSLVDDLFELARIDAGEMAYAMQRVAVPELLSETVEAMRPQAEEKGLRLTGEVAGGAACVTADPDRLQRVLLNLVQNAVRHTPDDGSVTVRAEAADGAVLFEVADTGEGISEDDVERAFDRFWRGGSAGARPAGGAGLGLSICRAIVEAHGGRIWIEPQVPAGTRVRFTVPAAP